MPADLIAHLDAPEKIEVWRVKPSWEAAEGEEASADLHDTVHINGPVPVLEAEALGTTWAKAFAAVWKDPNTYLFDSVKACEWQPGVMVRLSRGQEVADFVLCFECEEFQRHWKGQVDGEDFDPAKKRLLTLIAQVFPDDPALKQAR